MAEMSTRPPGQGEAQARALAEIQAAIAVSNFDRARDVADAAIGRGMRHPALFNARALWLQGAGRFAHALKDFELARQITPYDPNVYNAIGLCLIKLNRAEDAVRAFDAALALNPNSFLSHQRRGWALALMGHPGAKAAYERAIEIDPNNALALGSLASLQARDGEIGIARALAGRALEIEPGHPTAIVALATADIAEKDFSAAEQRLRPLLGDTQLTLANRAVVLGLLADALDGQKRYSEAFSYYAQQNDDMRRENAHRTAGGRAIDSARNLFAYFGPAPAEQWKAPDDGGSIPGAPASHVFLLGFMRSGTTLLEQVLASSPQVVALEERGLLNSLSEKYLTSTFALDALAAIGGAELARQRQAYWDRLRELGVDVAGKVFIDKQPLNTVKLPLIAKLFPNARIVFAMRDPRDVVFSCFRRQFSTNITMFEFLSLVDTADFYAAVMQLSEVYREKFSLNLFEHYYEDMVQDFEGRVRAVCDFIGAEWTEAMRDFNRNAPLDIRSPSATQVARPLYGEGIGQWRSYAEQLAPILPIVEPWVRRFRYPAS
jgi:tetratricopeptide (TPR) repeat protein